MVHFAYMPSPIPRQVRWNFVRSYIPSTSAFPETGAGRLLHHYFRGLLSVVGSRNGAMLRRSDLSGAPRFLWECLTNRTVSWFPFPATSNRT
jgi:hypothetical protein